MTPTPTEVPVPMSEPDRLRILFRPRGNLLRCSCFAGMVGCTESDGDVRELAELLAGAHGTRVHDRVPIHNKEDLDGVSILLAPVDRAPERVAHLAGSAFGAPGLPRAFVVGIEHHGSPLLWVGARDDKTLRDACRVMLRLRQLLVDRLLLAADLHVHTTASDGLAEPDELPALAAAAGLDVVAVTDHNTLDAVEAVRRHAPANLLVLAGEELTDASQNHVLLLGLDEAVPAGTSVEHVLEMARRRRPVVVQAHPTGSCYFVEQDGHMPGVEAFNFLSSSPRVGRDVVRGAWSRGVTVPVTGSSDAHLPEDLGRARTCVLVDRFEADEVLEEVRAGRGVAAWRGSFFGKVDWLDQLADLYRHTDVLEGKLVCGEPIIAAQESPPPRRQTSTRLEPTDHAPQVTVFCDEPGCTCRQWWYRLDELSGPSRLVWSEASPTRLVVNGADLDVHLHPGLDFDLSPWLAPGHNTLHVVDPAALQGRGVRLCLGRELLQWEISIEDGPFRPVAHASNLQCQDLLPKNYVGRFTYRTVVDASMLPGRGGTLFFQGVDATVSVCLDGIELTRRGMMHWEDAFEVPLPRPDGSGGAMELTLECTNRVGLSGLTNQVHVGRCIDLGAQEHPLRVAPDECDLVALRCGALRQRGFLCRGDGTVARAFLICRPGFEYTVPDPRCTPWLVQVGFDEPSATWLTREEVGGDVENAD